MQEVVIVTTGVANVASVAAAFRRMGCEPVLSRDPARVLAAKHVVLPGVGTFEAGMRALHESGLGDALRQRVADGRATLAICLGLQLLLEGSEESPGVPGLAVVPGVARRLRGEVRVPQLGWNRIAADQGCRFVDEGYAYFANSYALEGRPADWSVAFCEYGGRWVAALERAAVLACQFHPELSGAYGARLLRRFVQGTGRSHAQRSASVRVVPCLDLRDGRVVKGVRFGGLRDAGDPVESARAYEAQGADELTLLDVSATTEGRSHALETVRRVRAAVSIPLTVGGGLRSVDDAAAMLEAGADKVAVNTAALRRPELVDELAALFGRQCTVASIDAARSDGSWVVRSNSGTVVEDLNAIEWSREVAERGAGEILLTSWDRDGTRSGYELDLIEAVAASSNLPLVASGGASSAADCVAAVGAGASAVLAASILHDGDLSVAELKAHMSREGVEVRP